MSDGPSSQSGPAQAELGNRWRGFSWSVVGDPLDGGICASPLTAPAATHAYPRLSSPPPTAGESALAGKDSSQASSNKFVDMLLVRFPLRHVLRRPLRVPFSNITLLAYEPTPGFTDQNPATALAARSRRRPRFPSKQRGDAAGQPELPRNLRMGNWSHYPVRPACSRVRRGPPRPLPW